ncbi:MAG TPA: hypothetical protein VH083_15415 [Myxococcales bacterium]|nr:hypothetical protein [Myxococcales bacterium]
MDEAQLELLREASGLRLDKEGRFFHRGGLIEHERTLSVLHRGVHRAPDGRWATRIGSEWGYLDVEDAPFFVQQVALSESRLRGELLTGEWEEIESLASGADDALYARVRGERARLTRAAQASLLPWLHSDGSAFWLQLGGVRMPIGADGGPEPRK